MYGEKMSDFSKKIPVTTPESKPDECKQKRKMLLEYIGEKLYINQLNSKPSHIKSPRLIKESTKKEEDIKKNLKKDDNSCNDRKLKIHWNKI